MTDADALAALPYGAKLCAIASKLNEIDDLHKGCDNRLTSTTDASRITPQSEVHAMTAEAPLPPNPMQSLRERLIQEGSIIPEASIEKLRDKLNRKIIQVIDAGSYLHREIRKSFLDYAISVIVCRATDSLSEHESGSLSEKLRYIWTLRFSLLINKFDKFINFSFPKLTANSLSTSFARCGFYSPLKENMKNAP